jgi:hypothetical protein
MYGPTFAQGSCSDATYIGQEQPAISKRALQLHCPCLDSLRITSTNTAKKNTIRSRCSSMDRRQAYEQDKQKFESIPNTSVRRSTTVLQPGDADVASGVYSPTSLEQFGHSEVKRQRHYESRRLDERFRLEREERERQQAQRDREAERERQRRKKEAERQRSEREAERERQRRQREAVRQRQERARESREREEAELQRRLQDRRAEAPGGKNKKKWVKFDI